MAAAGLALRRRPAGATPPATLAAALDRLADDVESDHDVDPRRGHGGRLPPRRRLAALVAPPARPWSTPAKHRGARGVGVRRAEVGRGRGVRARPGRGLGPTLVDRDRQGIADSIIGRMARQAGGGLRSAPPGRGHRWPCRWRRAEAGAYLPGRRPPALPAGVRPSWGRVAIVARPSTCEPSRASADGARRGPARRPPAGGGGKAVIETCARHPGSFPALSVSDAAEDVIGVIRAGARGYVTKTIAAGELAAPSRGCGRATRCSRPGWRGSCWTLRPGPAGTALDPELDQITPWEREAPPPSPGLHLTEIAWRLEVSIKTVESHVSSVLRKPQLSAATSWPAGPPTAARSDPGGLAAMGRVRRGQGRRRTLGGPAGLRAVAGHGTGVVPRRGGRGRAGGPGYDRG